MNPNDWRIAQDGEHQWRVWRKDDCHFTMTAEAAVALKVALENAGV